MALLWRGSVGAPRGSRGSRGSRSGLVNALVQPAKFGFAGDLVRDVWFGPFVPTTPTIAARNAAGASSTAVLVKLSGSTSVVFAGGVQRASGAKFTTAQGRSLAGSASRSIAGRFVAFVARSFAGSSNRSVAVKRAGFAARSSAGASNRAALVVIQAARVVFGFVAAGARTASAVVKRIAAQAKSEAGGRTASAANKRVQVIATVAAGGTVFVTSSKRIAATGFVGAGGFSYSTGVKIVVGSARTASGASTFALIAPPSLSDVILIAGRWLVDTPISGVVISEGTDPAAEGAITLDGTAGLFTAITGTRKRS